jgi:hypothetical protein
MPKCYWKKTVRVNYSKSNTATNVYCYSHSKDRIVHDLTCTLAFNIGKYLDGTQTGDELCLYVKDKLDTLYQKNKDLEINSHIFMLIKPLDYALYCKLLLIIGTKYESHEFSTKEADEIYELFCYNNIPSSKKFPD